MKKLTEPKILQISNDISEGICRANSKDLQQVVTYWQDLYVKEKQQKSTKELDKLDQLIEKLTV